MAIRALIWNENEHEKIRAGEEAVPGRHSRRHQGLCRRRRHQGRHRHHGQPEHGLTAESWPRPTCCCGGPTWRMATSTSDGRAGAAAGVGGHGPDRPALRPLLEDLQAADGHAVLAQMARGRREVERIWITNRNHPIAAGLPEYIEIEHEEMYGEPFTIPEPMETLMISWFEGGEVFRSGCTFQRGAGKIFYFRPGHEAYPTYHNQQVLTGDPQRHPLGVQPGQTVDDVDDAPNVPHDKAPVPLRSRDQPAEDGEKGNR